MPEKEEVDALQEMQIDHVREGDLLFFIREGDLQNLFWSVGDIWVHTAMAIDLSGGMCTGEVGTAPRVFSRSLPEAVEAFDLTVVGRLDLPEKCLSDAAEWVKGEVGEPQKYDWENFLLAGLVVLTRRGLPSHVLDNLGVAMETVFGGSGALEDEIRTCASFVYEAFERLGADCRIPILLADGDRFQRHGSTTAKSRPPVSYSDLQRLSSGDRQSVLGDSSLYELLEVDHQADSMLEGVGSSRITEDDVSQAADKLFKVAKVYFDRQAAQLPASSPGTLPGPLVSPTDLWHSERIGFKARVVKP